MKTLTTIQEMRADRTAHMGDTVGFVPTMGYLHDGHLSLVHAARGECAHVVASVFVNPTQFGPREDYERYPRDLGRDLELLAHAGTDMVFAPTAGEMYPDGFTTSVIVEGALTTGLCGKSRPTHFRGVATVVAKLFAIVRPTRAYFGHKDAQQVAVIRRMAADLNLGVDVIACPTVREDDGVAMSSRNAYLSPEQRAQAVCLYRALELARARIDLGVRNAGALREELLRHFARYGLARVDYMEFVDAETFDPVAALRGHVLLALAVYIGTTRLIDNAEFVVSE